MWKPLKKKKQKTLNLPLSFSTQYKSDEIFGGIFSVEKKSKKIKQLIKIVDFHQKAEVSHACYQKPDLLFFTPNMEKKDHINMKSSARVKWQRAIVVRHRVNHTGQSMPSCWQAGSVYVQDYTEDWLRVQDWVEFLLVLAVFFKGNLFCWWHIKSVLMNDNWKELTLVD